MALKSIAKVVETAKPAGKSDMPEFSIKGNLITRYTEAVAAMKTAEETVKELRPDLLSKGLAHLFQHNTTTHSAVSSIRLVDDESACRLTFQDKYLAANADVVDAVFTAMKQDINQFVQETIKVSFDSKVFLGKNGETDVKVYGAFKAAIDATAAKLGVASPLSAKAVVLPKPNFTEVRWSKFNAEQNAQISTVLPNTVTITPLA